MMAQEGVDCRIHNNRFGVTKCCINFLILASVQYFYKCKKLKYTRFIQSAITIKPC